MNAMSTLAIIPARAGSKGLPGKNSMDLLGKPLISWSIEQALASKFISKVFVSTDSPSILDIARGYPVDAPFLRPEYLATDDSSVIDVVKHVIDYYGEHGESYDFIVLLEPTSPIRKESDIDSILSSLFAHQEEYDSIVSIGTVTHSPYIMKKLDGLNVSDFIDSSRPNLRRQEYEDVYFPYGVAYAIKTESFLAEKTFYSKRCMGFQIDRCQHYEIDDLYDFLCVESVMRHFLTLTQ